MNAIIDELYRTQTVTTPGGSTYPVFPDSIKRPEGEALYQMVRKTRPRSTLEVGMAWGLSTLFICQALADNGPPAGHHTAIDPYQSKYYFMALENIKRAGLSELLTFCEESSQLAMPELVKKKQTFEFIFIDGSHVFDAALVDFYFADCLAPVGGLIVLDDLWMPSIQKLVAFIVANRQYEVAREHIGGQTNFTVLRKMGADARAWNHFGAF